MTLEKREMCGEIGRVLKLLHSKSMATPAYGSCYPCFLAHHLSQIPISIVGGDFHTLLSGIVEGPCVAIRPGAKSGVFLVLEKHRSLFKSRELVCLMLRQRRARAGEELINRPLRRSVVVPPSQLLQQFFKTFSCTGSVWML
jgi:hypothetical protein